MNDAFDVANSGQALSLKICLETQQVSHIIKSNITCRNLRFICGMLNLGPQLQLTLRTPDKLVRAATRPDICLAIKQHKILDSRPYAQKNEAHPINMDVFKFKLGII